MSGDSEAVELAIALVATRTSPETIRTLTGLSLRRIEKLASDLEASAEDEAVCEAVTLRLVPVDMAALFSRPLPAPKTCQWFVSAEHLGPAARQCGQPSAEGKPYCPAHCDRAYVNVERSARGRSGWETRRRGKMSS